MFYSIEVYIWLDNTKPPRKPIKVPVLCILFYHSKYSSQYKDRDPDTLMNTCLKDIVRAEPIVDSCENGQQERVHIRLTKPKPNFHQNKRKHTFLDQIKIASRSQSHRLSYKLLLSAQRVFRTARHPSSSRFIHLLMSIAVPVHNLRRRSPLLIHDIPNMMHDKVNSHCNNAKRTLNAVNTIAFCSYIRT